MRTLDRRIARLEKGHAPRLTDEERLNRMNHILDHGHPKDPRVIQINEILERVLARSNAGEKPLS